MNTTACCFLSGNYSVPRYPCQRGYKVWADILMAKEGFHDVEEKNTEDGHSGLLTVRGRQRRSGK